MDISKNSDSGEWAEKYVKILSKASDDYEKEHPHWRIEVLVSFIHGSLKRLKHFIEDTEDSQISWNSPFVELQYPVEWNWEMPPKSQNPDAARNGMRFGNITKQDMSDEKSMVQTLAEIMVRRLNILALDGFTNGAWFEIKDDYQTPILPFEISKELNAIKGKRAQRKYFDHIVRPFSIGAALIDYSGTKMEDGAPVPKHVRQQLANIGNLIDIKEIELNGIINGREIRMSLVFQIHPLIANYDTQKAYYPITVGLATCGKNMKHLNVKRTKLTQSLMISRNLLRGTRFAYVSSHDWRIIK